jgi:hypothetical protein
VFSFVCSVLSCCTLFYFLYTSLLFMLNHLIYFFCLISVIDCNISLRVTVSWCYKHDKNIFRLYRLKKMNGNYNEFCWTRIMYALINLTSTAYCCMLVLWLLFSNLMVLTGSNWVYAKCKKIIISLVLLMMSSGSCCEVYSWYLCTIHN